MADGRERAASTTTGMMAPRPVKTIAVTSGKGGVGKTCVAVNLAVALAARGRDVMLLDADLGLANVDVLLGLDCRRTLADVLAGDCTLAEIVVAGPHGLRIVPAASGIGRLAALSPAELSGLVRAFSDLGGRLDTLIVDTSAGLSPAVTTFTQAAHRVLVVVCDEPASRTDAYALIKLLSRDHGVGRFELLASQVASEADGRELFRKLGAVCERFLDVTLDYAGSIPADPLLRRSLQAQRAVVDMYPSGLAGRAFKNLAHRADNWAVPVDARGHLEFFVERLVAARPLPTVLVQ